jgi:hypothetical protein
MRSGHDWGFFQWFCAGFLVVFGFILVAALPPGRFLATS